MEDKTTTFWMKKIDDEIRNKEKVKIKAQLISFINNRAYEVENNIHDSIEFKNGFYLAAQEVKDKMEEIASLEVKD